MHCFWIVCFDPRNAIHTWTKIYTSLTFACTLRHWGCFCFCAFLLKRTSWHLTTCRYKKSHLQIQAVVDPGGSGGRHPWPPSLLKIVKKKMAAISFHKFRKSLSPPLDLLLSRTVGLLMKPDDDFSGHFHDNWIKDLDAIAVALTSLKPLTLVSQLLT